MTVSTEVDHNDYTGNGVTTAFPYTFRIYKKSDLLVTVVDLDENISELVLDTNYTVIGAGAYHGGNVVLTTPLANGWKISIERVLPVTQETDLRNQGKFFAEVHEDAFDKLTMLIQQALGRFSLALRKPTFIANYYDAQGNRIRNLADPSQPQDAATKNYVDMEVGQTNQTIQSLFDRTLRVPENSIPMLAPVDIRKNKLQGYGAAGEPIYVLPPSGSASDVMIELAKPTGSTLIGHEGHTVGQYLDGIGKMVFPGDDLKAALEGAEENEIVQVIGDVALSQSVVLTKAVSIDCSKGRILWNGTGNCIRYLPPVLQTYTEPVSFTGGQNSVQFPSGHGVQVGQLLCCYSNERRAGASLGDYYRGQYFIVRKVTGQQVEFYPSVLETFNSNKIEVRKPTANMQHYFRLKQTTPTGTPGGVIFDMPYSLNCSGYIELDCNRDPNVGFGIGGHNHNFTFNIQGITNGATGYNVMGYGVGATGTRMDFKGTGSNCRHLCEIPDGSILSADIHFDINATKEVGNPLYLYIAGAHCNVLGWSLSGRISGSGGMVQDRSGTCHFHNLHFDCQDDGYGDGYYCIGVSELYPTQTLIENVTMTVSGVQRKTLVEWDIKGQSTQNGLLRIRDCITKGRARILKLRDTGAGATTHTYRFRIESCTGEASSIHNRDLANSNIYMELFNNTWSTIGLDVFPDYMAGSDSAGCKVYEVHSANNVINDTNVSGVFAFNGYMDAIDFSSSSDKNEVKPFLNMVPTYLGSIVRLDINGLSTKGKLALTPTAATTFQDVGQVRFCKIGIDDAVPIAVGLAWPLIYTGCSFNNSFDATLVSTKRPQGANVSLKGKALNWNGTNIAV